MRGDDVRVTTRADDGARIAELILDMRDHAVECRSRAVNQTALHTFDGISTDHMLWRVEADLRELGCAPREGIA